MTTSSDIALRFEDLFEFSIGKDGRRSCSINIDAMTLILAEGKDPKIVSKVFEDIIKMNQIMTGRGNNWVKKAESERDMVYLVQNSFDVNYFLSELIENLGMQEKFSITESEPLV